MELRKIDDDKIELTEVRKQVFSKVVLQKQKEYLESKLAEIETMLSYQPSS